MEGGDDFSPKIFGNSVGHRTSVGAAHLVWPWSCRGEPCPGAPAAPGRLHPVPMAAGPRCEPGSRVTRAALPGIEL